MESSMSTPNQSQTGASIVWRDAPTTSVNVGGTKFVYHLECAEISLSAVRERRASAGAQRKHLVNATHLFR
jgi:hypothetical protein